MMAARGKQNLIRWGKDKWLGGLLAISLATHLLWLDLPAQVIFDEVHFGKFVTAYCCSHERFFDIHPPHGKLWIAAGAKLFGYDGKMEFDRIGEPYEAASAGVFRFWPAIWGAALPGIIFWLVRELGGSRAAAFFAGVLLALDNALTVQTRIMALDGLMLVGIFGGLAAYIRGGKGGGWLWFIGAGVLIGFAAGTKLTGLSGLLLIGFITAARMIVAGDKAKAVKAAKGGMVVLLTAVMVYGGGWAAHWLLLKNAGPGDVWGVPDWGGNAVLDFSRETLKMHKTMFNANYNLTATHPYSSPWYEWPVMKRPVYYWNADPQPGRAGGIYFLGNPVVWWGGGMLFAVALMLSIMQRIRVAIGGRQGFQISNQSRKFKILNTKVDLWIPLVGFVISYAPLTRVPRALFLYHYLTPLLFSLVFGALWLEGRGWISNQGIEKQAAWYWIVIGAGVATFLFFAPLTFGWLVPEQWFNGLFWFESWR